ncbi:MAG: sugar isomerase [Clostridiales bacterium]|nr:sugar isomerase [Clostridiales bacterium]
MYDYRKFTLGVAPTRRDFFPAPANARQVKERMMVRLQEIFAGIEDLTVVDLEGINEEGMLYDYADVPKAEKKFKEAGVDAVFFPHCNFGQEEPVAMLAKKLGVPVLVWGPRDEYPPDPKVSPNRQTDIQCGLFATTKALMRYGIPYTYIENCWLEAPVLEQGIRDFIRTASAVKAFRNCRILQLSTRPRQFLSVKYNESELLEKFGIEIIPVESAEIVRTVKGVLENRPADVKALTEEWKRDYDIDNTSDERLDNMAAIALGITELADKYGCSVVAGECWSLFSANFGVNCCFVWGWLTGQGLPVACETDVLGAVTTCLLSGAARKQKDVFLADITIRHPENDNAELFWHCGPFPASLVREGVKPCIINCKGDYELEHTAYTLARFDQEGGNYSLFVGEGKGVDGPPTNGNYVWIEVKDWVAWEKQLMYGPYIHHCGGTPGNLKDVLIEACRYIPGLKPDPAV